MVYKVRSLIGIPFFLSISILSSVNTLSARLDCSGSVRPSVVNPNSGCLFIKPSQVDSIN